MKLATTKAMAASAAGTPKCTAVLSIGVGGIAATSSATLSAKPQ